MDGGILVGGDRGAFYGGGGLHPGGTACDGAIVSVDGTVVQYGTGTFVHVPMEHEPGFRAREGTIPIGGHGTGGTCLIPNTHLTHRAIQKNATRLVHTHGDGRGDVETGQGQIGGLRDGGIFHTIHIQPQQIGGGIVTVGDMVPLAIVDGDATIVRFGYGTPCCARHGIRQTYAEGAQVGEDHLCGMGIGLFHEGKPGPLGGCGGIDPHLDGVRGQCHGIGGDGIVDAIQIECPAQVMDGTRGIDTRTHRARGVVGPIGNRGGGDGIERPITDQTGLGTEECRVVIVGNLRVGADRVPNAYIVQGAMEGVARSGDIITEV